LAVVAIAGQCGAIAVIHGRGVDAILIVTRLAGAGGAGTAGIVRTASATPSASASATGGSSWSCVHSPLKAAGPGFRSGAVLQNFSTSLQIPDFLGFPLVAAGVMNVGALTPFPARAFSRDSGTPFSLGNIRAHTRGARPLCMRNCGLGWSALVINRSLV
jgi:hypothetical protein